MNVQSNEISAGRSLRLLVLILAMALGAACFGGDSGSSSQPICDGSGDAGGVAVVVSPTPCDAAVDVPTDCPMAVICQLTVVNGNSSDIDVSLASGSVSVAPLDFTVLQGENRTVDVFYTCGADVDESGVFDIDVSLPGGPGAFCGAQANWSVDVTLVP